MTYATFEETGLKDIQTFDLLRNGVYSDAVVPPKKVMEAIRSAIAAWAAVPANIALIVRNEIKDQTRAIQVSQNQAVNYEQLLTKARAEITVHQAEIAKLQATAVRLESGSSSAKRRL
jgi:enoyl-CoA hydratase/carnithine racemase